MPTSTNTIYTRGDTMTTRTPDYTGTATIYTDKYQKIGTIELYNGTGTDGKPDLYGKITLTQLAESANIGLWKQKPKTDQPTNQCKTCGTPIKPEYQICFQCNEKQKKGLTLLEKKQ
jgi:hypothetical protein